MSALHTGANELEFATDRLLPDATVFGRLTQLVRVPSLQGGGHWFESSIAHSIFGKHIPNCFRSRLEPVTLFRGREECLFKR